MKCQCAHCDNDAQYVDLNSSDFYCRDCIVKGHDQ